MRRSSSFLELLLGRGLATALVLTLGTAAGLAVFGLATELLGTRTVVVAQGSSVLVAADSRADADDHEGHESDEAADPAHPEPTPSDPVARAPAPPALTRSNQASPGATPDASPLPAADVAAAPSPAPSPGAEPPAETVAAEEPPPPAVAARVRPTPGPRGPARPTADIPIVMYHHVGLLPPNPDIFRKDLTVAPETFEKTLQMLKDQEVQTVTMADLFEHFVGGQVLPKKSTILTFDDGYDDNFEYAFRLLQKFGMVGTFFICTDFVDKPGYLTWSQIAEMAEAGMEIEAHTLNHVDLTVVSAAELRRQLTQPKEVLEQNLGQKVRFLAYPSGKYNQAVINATRAAGYEAAVTVIHGTRHTSASPFDLRRVRAHGADTAAALVARMTPAAWR